MNSAFLFELLGWLSGKESTWDAEDIGDATDLTPGSGRSPGGEHGNPLQYSWLGGLHGQRSLVGYSPWCHTESDVMETTEHTHVPVHRGWHVCVFVSTVLCCPIRVSDLDDAQSNYINKPTLLLESLWDDHVENMKKRKIVGSLSHPFKKKHGI